MILSIIAFSTFFPTKQRARQGVEVDPRAAKLIAQMVEVYKSLRSFQCTVRIDGRPTAVIKFQQPDSLFIQEMMSPQSVGGFAFRPPETSNTIEPGLPPTGTGVYQEYRIRNGHFTLYSPLDTHRYLSGRSRIPIASDLWSGQFQTSLENNLVALLLGRDSTLVPLTPYHPGFVTYASPRDSALLVGKPTTTDGAESDVVLHKTVRVDGTAAEHRIVGQTEIHLGHTDHLLRRMTTTSEVRGQSRIDQDVEFEDIKINEPISLDTFALRPTPCGAEISLPREVDGESKSGAEKNMIYSDHLRELKSLSLVVESETTSEVRRGGSATGRTRSTSRTQFDVDARGRVRYEYADSALPTNNILQVSDGHQFVVRDSHGISRSRRFGNGDDSIGQLLTNAIPDFDFVHSFYNFSEHERVTPSWIAPQIGDPEVVGGETVDVLQWVQARSDMYGIPYRFEVKRAYFRQSDGLPFGKSFFTSENKDGVETVTRRIDKVTSLVRNPALDLALFAVDKLR